MTPAQKLFYSIHHNELEEVKALITINPNLKTILFDHTVNYKDHTPLLLSVVLSQEAIVSFLLSAGANPNAQESRGYSCLHSAIINNNYNIARLLLEYQADPNLSQNLGYTPLHTAVGANNMILTALLLQFGAQVNACTISGITPLHLASTKIDDGLAMVTLLISYGARTLDQDYLGKTPLDCARDQGCHQILDVLLEAEASGSTNLSDPITTPLSSPPSESYQGEKQWLLLKLIENFFRYLKQIFTKLRKRIGLLREKNDKNNFFLEKDSLLQETAPFLKEESRCSLSDQIPVTSSHNMQLPRESKIPHIR